MLKATVSGSFHRHMPAIYTAVNELRAARVSVLSPADPRIVDHLREFLFVASDRTRFKRQVQQRHFEAIGQSDFLWLVCPDGYVGVSAAMEIGWALQARVPVFSDMKPSDVTAEDFVTVVPSIKDAIAVATRTPHPKLRGVPMLLDPSLGAQAVIDAAEQSEAILNGRIRVSADDANQLLQRHSRTMSDALATLTK